MSYQTISSISKSQRSYLKPIDITHGPSKSRDSSRDSQHSRSSTDSYNTSSSKNTMGSSNRESENNGRVSFVRVPENDRHYVKTTRSENNKIEVHDEGMARFDEDEPRASYATSEDYKRKQEKEWRRREANRRSGGR